MTTGGTRLMASTLGGLLLLTGLTGCSSTASGPDAQAGSGGSGDAAAEVAYCSSTVDDADLFWDAVHASCAVAQDGDVAQAEALRAVLDEMPTADVAAFQRTLVRTNRSLRTITEVADELCAPGLGLGPDLSTDYRSWVIAHGRSAYEAVLADPEALRQLPDATLGCGRGEPFGAAAFALYLDRTGLRPGDAGLPTVDGR